MAAKDDLSKARDRYRKGNPDGAADVLERLLEREPGNVAAHLLLARCYSRMRQGEDAVAEIEEALNLEPDNVEARTLRGAEHYFADELDEAADLLQAAIDQDGNAVEAYVRLAQVRTDQKEFQEAEELLDQAAERAGENREALALVRMGQVYLAMQRRRHDDALQIITDNEELWKLSPYVEATVRSNEAVIHARQRQFNRARELLVDVLDLDPYFHTARALLGQIAAMERDHEFAVEQLQQVVENSDEPSAQVRYALATSLSALGRHEEANAQYAAALASGLSGVPALTARLNVLVPNPAIRMAIGLVLLALIAFVAFRTLPIFMAAAIVFALALIGRQLLRGGR